ncbi:MAG TPA: hypothetical protein VIV83_07535 [Gemmatimonadales bacterium]|jgi:hypothetical protein
MKLLEQFPAVAARYVVLMHARPCTVLWLRHIKNWQLGVWPGRRLAILGPFVLVWSR